MFAAILAGLAWRAPRICGWSVAAGFALLAGGWHHFWWSDLTSDDLAKADWANAGRRPCWVRGVPVEEAKLLATADDSYKFVINGTLVLSGNNFHEAAMTSLFMSLNARK